MHQLVLPLDLPSSFKVEDFIVSPSNKEAYLWVQRWPDWPTPCLSLYGEEGCGKTHLSHVWQNRAKAWRLQAVEFNGLSLSELFNSPPFFILEEAHLLEKTEKLFHFYNHLSTSKGSVLFLSPTPPAHWTIELPDLRSRLNAIVAVKIHPPDEDLLAHVIQKLFNDLQLKVEDTVVRFLLKHIERSFEKAQYWVNLLNTAALAQKRPVTIPLVREILMGEGLVGRDPQVPLFPTPTPPIFQEES